MASSKHEHYPHPDDFAEWAKTENVSDSESPTQPRKLEKWGGEIPCADYAALCSNLDKLMQGSLTVKYRLVLLEARSFVARESRNFHGNFQLKIALSDGIVHIVFNGDRSNQTVVERNSKNKIDCIYTMRNFTTTIYDGVRGTGYAVTNTLGWLFGGVKKAIGY